MNFLGFGGGASGVVPTSGTFGAGLACSGTAAATSLVVSSSASFTIGDRITIIQLTGSSSTVGKLEENYVVGKPDGTHLTLLNPLANTYTNSGTYKGVVVITPEYSGGDISSTWNLTTWNSSTLLGGLFVIASRGVLTISGSVNGKGDGYQYGATEQTGGEETGVAGYGYVGDFGGNTRTANESGGGGGGSNYDNPGGGGGGGAAGAGSNGGNGSGGYGYGGSVSGVDATGTRVVPGGSGGNGGTGHTPCQGGRGGQGGGIVIITARKVVMTGTIDVRGNDGTSAAIARGGGGGGGGGGTILIRAIEAEIGTNKLLASAGNGGGGLGTSNGGGAGGAGKVVVRACKITGSTSYGSATLSQGGYSYCASNSMIME